MNRERVEHAKSFSPLFVAVFAARLLTAISTLPAVVRWHRLHDFLLCVGAKLEGEVPLTKFHANEVCDKRHAIFTPPELSARFSLLYQAKQSTHKKVAQTKK
jgi:hypothetical protein